MFNIGPAELMVIFILALLVFGPKKLPEVSRQIGRGIREFRRASDQIQDEIQGALNLEDDDEATDDAPDEPAGTTTAVSANGHSAETAATVPESTDGSHGGDEGSADGPATSERTD